MLYINGRSVVHRRSGGFVKTVSVNLTGSFRVPIPYANIAFATAAVNTCRNLRCNGEPLCHLQSYFAKSQGDEAGTFGGIVSGTINGRAEFISGSPNVTVTTGIYCNAIPLVRAGDLMVSNNRNTAPAPLQQGIIKTTQTKQSLQQLTTTKISSDWICHHAVNNHSPQSLSGYIVLHDQQQTLDCLPLGQISKTDQPYNRQYLTAAAPFSSLLSLVLSDCENGLMKIPLTASAKLNHRSENSATATVTSLILELRQQTNPNSNVVASRHYSRQDLYRLPISLRSQAQHQLQQRSKSLENWFNALTPELQHLVQTQFDPRQNQSLRPGWIYLFRDGYLWRELKVLRGNCFQDVDLERYLGRDQRHATGEAIDKLLLVYRDQQRTPRWEIAYAETQWIWQRISAYGGFNPNDPRLKSNKQPVGLVTKRHDCNAQRRQRFTSIDLANLQAATENKLPQILLPDPLAQLRAAIQDSFNYQTQIISNDAAAIVASTDPIHTRLVVSESLGK